jgi:polar amino acid transport system substrate-binding protein
MGSSAGINLSNFLLVTGCSASGDLEGVSSSLARAIADRLGIPVWYVLYPRPGELADAVGTGSWDIG